MIALLIGFLILYACALMGRTLLGAFRLLTEPEVDWVWGAGLGLGLLAYGVLTLGILGILTPLNLCILIFLTLLIGFPNLWADLQSFPNIFSPGAKSCWDDKAFNVLFFLLSFVTLGCGIAGVLAPETANDSLCYHLHLPKIYLMNKSIGYYRYELNAAFPFLMEMLFTLGLGIQGVTLAKFFHFAAGLLTAAGIFVYAKRWIQPRYAACAAAIFLTTPGILNEMATTYVDVGLSLYILLGLWTCLEGIERRQASFLAFSGVFFGFAMSIKYLALIPVLFVGILLLYKLMRGSIRKRGVFLFAGMLVLSCFYWYLKAALKTGNPVFPYFYGIFKSGFPIHYDDIGVPKNLLSFLAVPWTLTMRPQLFEGFGAQMGPAYLALLPAGIALGRQYRQVRYVLAFLLFFLTAWFLLGQSLRFFFPALPFLAVLAGFAMQYFEPLLKGYGSRLLVLGILFLHAGFAGYHFRGDFKVAAGRESETEYLERNERVFSVARFVNQNLPAKVKILAADETHLFYFDRPMFRELAFNFQTQYAEKAGSAAGVFKFLTDRGITHILAGENERMPPAPGMNPLRLPRLFREAQNQLAAFLEPLYTNEFADPKQGKFRYTLYRLKSS